MLARIRNSRSEGFTLIELLIVIIILGILAAIVVFAVGSTRKDSLSATCKTDMKSIQLAEEALNTKTGAYTNDASATSPLLSAAGGVLKSWPTNSNITFTLTGTGTTHYTAHAAGTGIAGGDVTDLNGDTEVNAACAPA